MNDDKLVRGGYQTIKTQYGEMGDISIHMEELPELYKLHKEYNKDKEDDDKALFVHINVLKSKKGNLYLKFNDYPINDERKAEKMKKKATKKADEPVESGGSEVDDLPF